VFVAGAVPDRPSTMVIGLAGIIFASSIILRIFRQPTAASTRSQSSVPPAAHWHQCPFRISLERVGQNVRFRSAPSKLSTPEPKPVLAHWAPPASTNACRSSDSPSSRLHLHRQINVGPNRELGPQVNGCQPGMMRRCLLFRNRFTSRKPQNVRLTPLCATRRRLFGLSASARSDGGRS